MRFVSTRGGDETDAKGAVLAGVARDGGLFLPERWPDLSALAAPGLAYGETALRVFSALLPGFGNDVVWDAAHAAGAVFDSPEVTPLVPVGDAFALELFHGPTGAFKDVALSALPRLLRGAMPKDKRMLVVTATSGDTGSAAMRGFRGLPGFRVLVYYPQGGVSAAQERQMRTMPGDNLDAVAILGDFDDAQAGVKAFFKSAGAQVPGDLLLGSANSINIGRLLPQVVYYLRACARLRETGALQSGETADFAVPTGNFGDILAGYIAKRAGAPVGRLLCASNANRALYDFLKTGVYDRRRELRPTLSPSMDILVSGNLERLLFLNSSGDAALVRSLMDSLAQTGRFEAPESLLAPIREDFGAGYATDAETLAAIREAWEKHRYLLDPHAATAWAAMKKARETDRTTVVLATASPFKFPRAVFQALGMEQPEGDEALPERLGGALGLPVPAPLAGLWDRPLLRGETIPKEALARDALERAMAWR